MDNVLFRVSPVYREIVTEIIDNDVEVNDNIGSRTLKFFMSAGQNAADSRLHVVNAFQVNSPEFAPPDSMT
jgi:hypothetical protein